MTLLFLTLCNLIPILAFLIVIKKKPNLFVLGLTFTSLFLLESYFPMIAKSLLTFCCLFAYILYCRRDIIFSYTFAGCYFCNELVISKVTSLLHLNLFSHSQWWLLVSILTVIDVFLQLLLTNFECYLYDKLDGNKLKTIGAALASTLGFIYSIWRYDLAGITAADSGSLLRSVLVSGVAGLMMLGLLLVLFAQRTIEEKTRIAQEKIQLENSGRYYRELANNTRQLRNFKHDFQNICLGMDLAIKNGDLMEITEYFDQHIKKAGKQLIHQNNALLQLEKIQSIPLRSLLYAKLGTVDPTKIQLTLTISDEITFIDSVEAPLIRGLGIILDNALDELAESKQGEILLSLQLDGYDTIITVENTCHEGLPSLAQLQRDGFSTKGAQRGYGLTSLNECFAQSPFLLKTAITKGLFSQSVRIEGGIVADAEHLFM